MRTTAKVRVLYLDQASPDRERVRVILAQEPGGFELVEVADRAAFEERLGAGAWDLALCGLPLPGYPGLQVLDAVRASGDGLPVVLLGNPGEAGAASEALRRGASGFIAKTTHELQRLPATIHAALQKRRDRADSASGASVGGPPVEASVLTQRLVSTLESMPDPFVTLARDWTFTYLNPRAGELFGHTPEALVGRNIWEVFPERVGQAFQRIYERVLETGAPETFEDHYPPWKRWFENRVVPTGEGLSIFFLDITERKLAEAALRASEGRFHATLDSVLEGCQLIGFDWRYLYLNDAASRHNRRPNAELVGISMTEAWPGIEATEVFRMIKRCLEERIAFQGEVEFNFPDGGTGWYDVRCQPVPEGVFALSADITERKRAEAALRSSEERFKTMFVQAPLGIAVIDSITGRFQQVNPRFAEIAGRPMDELTRLDWMQITHPEDLQADLDRLTLLNAGKTAGYQMEKRYLRPDGTPVWIDMTIAPSIGGDPQHPRHLKMVQDITERKRTEAALRSSEERFKSMFAQAPLGVAVIDSITGRFQQVNPRFAEIAGRPMDELTSLDWMQITHPEDLQADQDHMTLLNAGKTTGFQMEKRYLRPDGSSVWIEMTVAPSVGGDQQHPRHLAMIQDITERKQAAEALRAREAQLSLIFDTIADVIFVISVTRDGGFRFQSVSRSFLEVTGLQEGQIVGRGVEEVIPEPALIMVLGKYREAMASGHPVHWEEVSEYPSGARTGEVTIVPVYSADGTCTQLIGTVHDITDRQRAAARIQGLNEELEQRVQERTAQLLAANQELESFSYSVSHDLRAPLRAVSGFAEIVARRHRADLNEEGRRYVDHIVTASQRMGELIEDLLAYARLGRSGMALQPMDLGETLAPILATMMARARAAGGDITVSGRMVRVVAQRTLLSQVVTNLLDNALSYHRPGVPPRIHLEVLPAPGQKVLVRVSDNGEGIAPEHHEKVFQVFQRLHGQESHPGTGIGLAIVKKSLELMGGSIHLESEPGTGSTFSFTLAKE